jgi:hypothetical protein
MKRSNKVTQAAGNGSGKLARPAPAGSIQVSKKSAGVFSSLVIATNFITYALFTPGMVFAPSSSADEAAHSLYLMDKAKAYVLDVRAFDKKVRKVARKLDVPAEWLMAVMYAESSFDASIVNRKGSKATGLIQFTPITAKDLNTTVDKIRNMNHVQQLDFVYEYLRRVRKRYGDFHSLTDLYLAILYPRALAQDYCYVMYEKPSITYTRNIGLDENKDGQVTVSDIDHRMQRIFPTAFAKKLGKEGEE